MLVGDVVRSIVCPLPSRLLSGIHYELRIVITVSISEGLDTCQASFSETFTLGQPNVKSGCCRISNTDFQIWSRSSSVNGHTLRSTSLLYLTKCSLVFGLTEAGVLLFVTPAGNPHLSSVGRAMPGVQAKVGQPLKIEIEQWGTNINSLSLQLATSRSGRIGWIA